MALQFIICNIFSVLPTISTKWKKETNIWGKAGENKTFVPCKEKGLWNEDKVEYTIGPYILDSRKYRHGIGEKIFWWCTSISPFFHWTIFCSMSRLSLGKILNFRRGIQDLKRNLEKRAFFSKAPKSLEQVLNWAETVERPDLPSIIYLCECWLSTLALCLYYLKSAWEEGRYSPNNGRLKA